MTNLCQQVFRDEASELLAEMEIALLELERRPDDTKSARRVLYALHSLKGAALTAGFEGLGALAFQAECAFGEVCSHRQMVTIELVRHVFAVCDQLQTMLDNDCEPLPR